MLIFVSGEKGGVGKSTVTHAVANYFFKNREKTIVLDLDARNPDVGRVYFENYDNCNKYDVTVDAEREKLIDFTNKFLREKPDYSIVFNCASYSQDGLAPLISALAYADPIILWVLGNHMDSYRLLASFLEKTKPVKICALANSFFGPKKAFKYFQDNAANTPLVYFPKANVVPMEFLYDKRIPIHHWSPQSEFSDKMQIDEWWEAEGWIGKSGQAVKEALGKAELIGELASQ